MPQPAHPPWLSAQRAGGRIGAAGARSVSSSASFDRRSSPFVSPAYAAGADPNHARCRIHPEARSSRPRVQRRPRHDVRAGSVARRLSGIRAGAQSDGSPRGAGAEPLRFQITSTFEQVRNDQGSPTDLRLSASTKAGSPSGSAAPAVFDTLASLQKHLAWLETLPCIVTGIEPCGDAHHLARQPRRSAEGHGSKEQG